MKVGQRIENRQLVHIASTNRSENTFIDIRKLPEVIALKEFKKIPKENFALMDSSNGSVYLTEAQQLKYRGRHFRINGTEKELNAKPMNKKDLDILDFTITQYMNNTKEERKKDNLLQSLREDLPNPLIKRNLELVEDKELKLKMLKNSRQAFDAQLNKERKRERVEEGAKRLGQEKVAQKMGFEKRLEKIRQREEIRQEKELKREI